MRQATLTPSEAPDLAIGLTNFLRYTDFIETFNVLLDLSRIHFAHINGCSASFVPGCYSFLECRT